MKKINTPPKVILSILLPVKNEGLNIRLMLTILEAILEIPHEVLIIYDHPNDKTVPVIKNMQKSFKNLKSIYNSYGKGVINAIKAGTENSEGKYILLLAVDDVGPALAIEDMVKLMDKGCMLVSCTRYKFGGRRLGGSWLEALLSKTGNKLFSLICGSSLSDATTGFKMFKKEIFNTINLESNPVGWAVVFEIAIKSQAAGFKLGEVPIISIDRLYGGKSSFRLGPWIKEYARWFLYGLNHLSSLRANRKTLVSIPKSTVS